MCGIAGVYAVPLDDAVVRHQIGFLGHRGPDSFGVHRGEQAAIGQSRLAVIDLVTGDPPITNEDRTIGVAFNGEIYNYRALRHALRRSGHDLKTEGDTEVIAHLCEDLAPADVCRLLDGMFAFAVWDETRSRLILGRDRLGKKPLYYWYGGPGRFSFGSEIKAVLADPRVPRRLAPDVIPAYLTFGYVPTPRTFYEGIVSLPPGHVLTLDDGQAPRIECYWQAAAGSGADPLDLTYEEAGREVRRLLCDAVDKRLLADVPLGAFLSGGVDSSAVVALMARLSPRPVRTFTIGFDDKEGFDERPWARKVSALYGTEHTEFVVNPDKAELIERLVWHHDQPFGDSSALPTFLLAELTRRHVTVALAGDGGDDLFAGYERFPGALALERLGRLPVGGRQALAGVLRRLPGPLLGGRRASVDRLMSQVGAGLPGAFLSWTSFVPSHWRAQLCPDGSTWGDEDYASVWESTAGAPTLDRLLLLTLRTYLLDDLLPKVDRMTMAHGLEVRSPFLDRDLVDLVLRLPPAFKLKGWSRKRILKEAVRDLLPHDVLHRRKRGFGVPLDRWFRTDLRAFVESTLTGSRSRIGEHLVPEPVADMVAAHLAGHADHGHALWTLLT
ncbi:MAG: asparagine synthase (glutamine-hydrolyzing), partial [Acidimicrobiales bacterium]